MPGWHVHVPAHVDEVDSLLRSAVVGGGRHHLRLTDRAAARLRLATPLRPRGVVIAVGPTVGEVAAAVENLDVTVLPVTTVRPFPADRLRRAVFACAEGANVVLVEPYHAGVSSYQVSAALERVPHRLLSLGVGRRDLRRYGSAFEHDAAHGLDAAGLRAAIERFVVR